MNVFGLLSSTSADSVMLHRVVSLPELAQTQAAAYHVFSGSEPTFSFVVELEERKSSGLQVRLFQESGSLLRPIGEARRLEQILLREKDVSQVLQIPIQLPEVQAVTSFVCVLQTLDAETGKATALRPSFRIKAYPSKDSYFTRIESLVKAVLNQTRNEAVQIFGPTDGPLVGLLKSCGVPTDDLGERPPDRWEPGNVTFGEFKDAEYPLTTMPQTKSALLVALGTDPDSGSRFLQMIHGQTRIRLQISDTPRPLEEDPEFLHLFTRNLQELISTTE